MDSLGLAADIMAELNQIIGCDNGAAELAGILQDLNFIVSIFQLLESHQ